MENVIDIETARLEVEKWLDFKRVRQTKRDSSKDTIDSIAEAVSSGQLVLNDDMSWKHNLDVSIDGDVELTSLTYKPRLTVAETHSKMKGVKAGDVDGRIAALIAALSSKPSALILKLDTSDYSVSTSIALFFL